MPTKVKFYKKQNTQDKIIKKWLLTGKFSNSFNFQKSLDKSKIHIVNQYIQNYPDKIESLIESTYKYTLHIQSLIYTLVLLSKNSFRAKSIFKTYFHKIIQTPKELYIFMEYCKKERGFGNIIKKTIQSWFIKKDVHELESLYLQYPYGNNWTMKDVIKLINPKPRNKKESYIFQYIINQKIHDDFYQKFLPKLYIHDLLKYSSDNLSSAIKEYDFTNTMIPSNIKRNDDYFIHAMHNPQNVLLQIPYYNLSNDTLNVFLDKIQIHKNISIVSILKAYAHVKENNPKLLSLYEEILLKSLYKNEYIHIVNTSDSMFKEEVMNSNPAIISSILIGKSENIFDFNGNKITRQNDRAVLEAEGFNQNIVYPNYKNISNAIQNIDSKIICIWSNTSYEKEFNQKILSWKLEHKKSYIPVFIYITNKKYKTNSNSVSIYGISNNIFSLLEMIERDYD